MDYKNITAYDPELTPDKSLFEHKHSGKEYWEMCC